MSLAVRRVWPVLVNNDVIPGAEPMALAYAGHQFGHFVPQLGDGRANLLGEVVGPNGIRRDIQLKGSGQTPFSRSGDGRAALGPVLREYLISEAMAALGVPTTRTLAAVTTGSWSRRETRAARAARRPASPRAISGSGHFRTLPPGGTRRACGCWLITRSRGTIRRPRGALNPYGAFLGGGDRAASRSGGEVVADRVHPWGDEHRQLLDRWRNDRLWSMRVHGCLRSRCGVQLDRPPGPLRLCQSTTHRAVEPDPAG